MHAHLWSGRGWLPYLIAALQGFASASVEPVIIGFNFMDRWASTTAISACRMAMAEPARLFLNIGMLGVAVQSNRA